MIIRNRMVVLSLPREESLDGGLKPSQIKVAGTNEIPHAVALVPTYNGAAFIKESLDSLAAQSYSNLSILISNDASSDETGAICDRYATEDTRFHANWSSGKFILISQRQIGNIRDGV